MRCLRHSCPWPLLNHTPIPPSDDPCSKHKVECDDKARFAFSMATDAFQLLPSPGAAAHPSPVMPLAGIPLGAAGIPAPPPFVPLPAGAEAAAAAWDGAAGAAVGSRRLAHLPPLEAPPPKKPAKTTQGPPVLPPEALPIARDRLQVRVRDDLHCSNLVWLISWEWLGRPHVVRFHVPPQAPCAPAPNRCTLC